MSFASCEHIPTSPMLHPESFTFIEMEIIRSPVYISFHRATITCFEFHVLSYVLGEKNNINTP